MLLIFVYLFLTCDAGIRLYQLMETNRIHAVLGALQQLVTCSDNEQIQAISATINQQMQQQGYIPILIHIIQSKEISQNILFAALTQLKNILKFGHSNYTSSEKKNIVVPYADLQFLLGSIISMNEQHSDNYLAFKLLKDIVGSISQHMVQLAPTLHQMLLAGKGLKACLNILLGMANYFKMSQASQQSIFIGVLKHIMPAIYELVVLGQKNLTALYWSWHQNQTNQALHVYNSEKEAFEEILYLAIKLVCKSIYNQIQFQQRQLYYKWAIIAQGRLEDQNELYTKKNNMNSCGKRGTHQFSYFHGKKWATKYLIKFFPTILQCKKSKPDVTRGTIQFLKEHGASLKDTLKKVLDREQPYALRYLELTLFQTFMKHMARLMRQQYEHYLFELLPKHAIMTSQQIHYLTQNPEQFFICEHARDSLRNYSTQIWHDFALSDSDKMRLNPKDQPHEGELIVQAYQKIKAWLFDDNWEVQQIALVYLIKLSSNALHYPRSSVIAAQLVNLCLPNIFNQPLMILQVRGFELVNHLRKYIKGQTYPYLQEIILNVFRQREDQNGVKLDVLAVYAGVALQKVISFGQGYIRAFTDDQIKLILGNLLYLIRQYEIAELNGTLTIMIQTYPKDMNCYAIQLLRYLTMTLKDIFSRAMQNKAQQLNQSAIETMGVIGILASLDSEDETFNRIFNDALEEEISSLLQFALFAEDKINNQYVTDLFGSLCSVINSKTNKVQQLSDRLNYFFTFLIFQLVPLDNRLLGSLHQSNLTPNQKSLLQLSNNDLLYTNLYFHLFKNYLKFIDPTMPFFDKNNPQHNLFHFGILNQFIYLIDYYYKQSKNMSRDENYSILRGRYLITILLTCLLEQHQGNLPSQLYVKILQIILVNGRKGRFKRQLLRKNIQLFCMWLYSYPNAYECLTLFIKSHSIMGVFIKLTEQNFTLEMNRICDSDIQRKRIILGFCKMVQLSAVDHNIQNSYSMIVLWIFHMIAPSINKIYGVESDQEEEDAAYRQQRPRRVNIDNWVFEYTQEQPERSTEENSLFEDNQDFDDEVSEDDSEIYPYTPLRTVNELQYLLETMLILRQIRPDFYYEQVMDQHKNTLENLLNLCSAELSSKYLCLLQK